MKSQEHSAWNEYCTDFVKDLFRENYQKKTFTYLLQVMSGRQREVQK